MSSDEWVIVCSAKHLGVFREALAGRGHEIIGDPELSGSDWYFVRRDEYEMQLEVRRSLARQGFTGAPSAPANDGGAPTLPPRP